MKPMTYSFEELVALKESGIVSEAAIEKLKSDADEILTKPIMVVTNVKLPRPSGDIHDYISVAPYWWPNPDTPDGLPWVGRDGVVNPDTRTGVHPSAMYGRIQQLALACFYIGDNGYSEYAKKQLYAWFIDPETRTNPNAKYGQSVPGVAEGRGAGLIEFCQVNSLYNALGILDCMGLIPEELISGIKAWFYEFANWMLTHELGIRIDNSIDNHASWYSANLLGTAIFTERPALIKKLCHTLHYRRIKNSIMPDGSQPEELRRTKALMYSFYNLDALFIACNLSSKNGYADAWGVDKNSGECRLKQAVDFLYPHVLHPESCPYSNLKNSTYERSMARVMLVVDKRFPNEGYAERAEALYPGIRSEHLEPLI